MKGRFLHIRFVLTILAIAIFLLISLMLSMPAQKAQDKAPLSATYDRFALADAATADMRDASKTFVRVMTPTAAAHAAAEKAGSVVGDYGPFVVIAADRGADLGGLETQELHTVITLPGKSFDPIVDPPAGTLQPGWTDKPGTGTGYYVVQLGTVANDEILDSLRDAGVEILQYVPNQAFFVYGDAAAMARAASHSRVRWVGAFLPEQKISDILNRQLAAASGGTPLRGDISPIELNGKGTATFDVAVFARADADALAVTATSAYGANVRRVIHLPSNYFNVIRLEIALDKVTELANIPDVITIDATGTPRAEDEKAAQIVAGNYTGTTSINAPGYNPLAQFGVNGTGVSVSVVDDGVSMPGDGGFYITSSMAVDGPLRGSTSGASGHGHLNASIIAGTTPFSATLDPNGYNYGLGIAPAANIINIPLLTGTYTGVEADCYNDTVVTSGPNGVKGFISNNSWGNLTNSNVYDAYTAQFDGFVRDASAAGTIDPILLVFSAGNSGPSALSLTRPKAAKNIIAVASSENIRTNLDAGSDNIDDISSFSSRGPAADGRVKPDIAAPGQAITGSRAGTDSLFGNIDTFHRWSEGTSHAAPQVAGAAALFTQFWKGGHGGVNPSPALVKAAILQTGREMNGVNAGTAVPNGNEGWGRINMKFMLNTGAQMFYADQEIGIGGTGGLVSYVKKIADGTKPTRITVVWTDPPGAANANPALVNNLDLTVTVNGNTYKGNVFTSGVSTTGGTADALNNVEQVWLPAGLPTGATVTIGVTGAAINGDGIPGNGDTTDQDFALVGYNLTAQTTPLSAVQADFDGDHKSDVSVWRPSTGVWYVLRSSDATFSANAFGSTGDLIAPGDYDGDLKTDMAVFRPSTGAWYIQRSTAGLAVQLFGLNGDLPVQGDYDGDGLFDVAVWRPSTGVWYLNRSATGFTASAFGSNGDKPVQGDYDGDGKCDTAVWCPAGGTWYRLQSTAGLAITNWGLSGDKPVQGDYDGDGKCDMSIWRPSNGTWYLLESQAGFVPFAFGTNGDAPAPGDFDGDSKADLGIFRPVTGAWYLQRSQAGFAATIFGSTGDIPVPAGYIPQ